MSVTRRWRVRSAALVAASVLASGFALPSAHASVPKNSGPIARAQTSEETLTETLAETTTFVVAPTAGVYSDPARGIELRVLLRNSGTRSLPEGSIELTLEPKPAGAENAAAPGDEGQASADPAQAGATPALIDSSDADSSDTDPTNAEAGTESDAEPDAEAQPADPDATADPAPRDGAADGAPEQALLQPTVLATRAVTATAADEEQSFTIAVPADAFPLTATSTPGVYTVTARFIPADGSHEEPLVTSTPIVWRGADPAATPVNLTLVVPLLLPADIVTMPTRVQLRAVTPGLNKLLEFATSSNAMLAIDPRIIASIRAFGVDAPAESRALLERLESSSLDSFLLQYSDADVTPQAALDLPELLQPASFDFVTRHGKFEAPKEPTPESAGTDQASADPAGTDSASKDSTSTETTETETETAEPEAPEEDPAEPVVPSPSGEPDEVLPPTLDELGAWEKGLPGAWPSLVTNQTLNFLNRSGLTFTVLDTQQATLTGGPRATLGSGTAIVTNAELDAAVRLALTGESEPERDSGLARAHALLVEAAEAGVPGLALSVDRGAILREENAVDVLTPLLSTTWVRTVALGAQTEGSAVLHTETPTDAPETETPGRTELLGAALANEPAVLEVRAMLENPEYLDGYQRMRLLTLFSTRYAADDVDFAKVAKRFEKRDAEISEGVSIVVSKHAQLVGVSSRIPIQLRNSLPFNAVAQVTVTPISAALSVEQRVFPDVHVADDSSDRVLVPVSSRVSSGESGLLISVTSTDGSYTAATSVFPISISTSIETIAIAILGLAAVLLFGFGIWRSVRRRRKGIARI